MTLLLKRGQFVHFVLRSADSVDMEAIAITELSDIESSYHVKFLRNEQIMRHLATVDPNSYAAVVVRSMDHSIAAMALMNEHKNGAPLNAKRAESILHEFSGSLRASELFTVWTPGLLQSIKTMANEEVARNGSKTSNLDRDARVCLAVMMNQVSAEESMKYADDCRQKYPHEVFFQRIYSSLFTFTKNWHSGLTASEEVTKLFPTDADVLHCRAGILRLAFEQPVIDYKNWNQLKKQIDGVKEAYETYLKIAPKDHRQFAENHYVLAYLWLKYSTPSTQIAESDLEAVSVYFQKGLNAERDVLPCFQPFHSGFKDFVAKYVNVWPSTYVYVEGETCTFDMSTHGLPGRSKTDPVPTDNIKFVDARRPTKR